MCVCYYSFDCHCRYKNIGRLHSTYKVKSSVKYRMTKCFSPNQVGGHKTIHMH